MTDEPDTRATIELRGLDVRVLLTHVALHGLAAILEDVGYRDVRLGWTNAMEPRPWLRGDGLDERSVGEAVRAHAAARATDSWIDQDVAVKGSPRGLMSPRLTPLSESEWTDVVDRRERVLDGLTSTRGWSDLGYLAALGEPAHWSHDRKGAPRQDDGAGRWEMQPRNQGSEFVGTRLRKLVRAVGARTAEEVEGGMFGSATGADPAARTVLDLGAGAPIDSGLVWCAHWGMGQFPTTLLVNAPARTSGHIGRSRDEYFYVPVWTAAWRPAKLRTVLACAQLADVAGVDLHRRWSVADGRAVASWGWLAARGVRAVIRFPIGRFGSDNAPERRALRGDVLRAPGAP